VLAAPIEKTTLAAIGGATRATKTTRANNKYLQEVMPTDGVVHSCVQGQYHHQGLSISKN
jgi:hypothetical protein